MLEPIPFAGMVEIDESFDRTASHMAGEYVSNTEPVAWINRKGEFMPEKVDSFDIPLYTHLVELTDFEIKGVLGLDECWIGEDSSMPNMIAFARAILRKAQEK